MTTLNTSSGFRFANPLASAPAGDFVSSDTAALASHMNDCASTRSRFFGLQTALESAHQLVSPRLVTVLTLLLLVTAGLASAI